MYKRPATTYNLRRTFFARTSYSEFAIFPSAFLSPRFLSAFLSPSQYLMCHARPAARKNKYSPRQPQGKKKNIGLRAPDPRSGGAGGHLEFFYYKLTVEEDAPPPKRNPRDGLKDLADRGFEASGGFLWALGLILEPFPASLAGLEISGG